MPASAVPETTGAALLVSPPEVIATTGAIVSTLIAWLAAVAALPAASETFAVIV